MDTKIKYAILFLFGLLVGIFSFLGYNTLANQKYVYIATNGTITGYSKYIPVYYFDGHNYINNTLLSPISITSNAIMSLNQEVWDKCQLGNVATYKSGNSTRQLSIQMFVEQNLSRSSSDLIIPTKDGYIMYQIFCKR